MISGVGCTPPSGGPVTGTSAAPGAIMAAPAPYKGRAALKVALPTVEPCFSELNVR